MLLVTRQLQLMIHSAAGTEKKMRNHFFVRPRSNRTVTKFGLCGL